MTTIATAATPWTATLDHRTGATLVGGPASPYRRVARCGDRHREASGLRPNYAARRLGALMIALCGVVIGAWFAGEVASSVAGQPVSAAETAPQREPAGSGSDAATPAVHVARAGDTLWSIADLHRGDGERDRFVDALVELNGGTAIQVGQAVRLP